MLYCLTEKSRGCGSSRVRSGWGGGGCWSSMGILSGGDSLLLLFTLLWWCCCCSQRRMAADRLRSARAGPSQTSSRAPLSSTMVPATYLLHTSTRPGPRDTSAEWLPAAVPRAAWWGEGGADQSERRSDKYAHLIKRDWINAIYFPFLVFLLFSPPTPPQRHREDKFIISTLADYKWNMDAQSATLRNALIQAPWWFQPRMHS